MIRYFKSTDGRDSWHWDGSKMHLDGNGHVDSIFTSPDELLAEVNVVETDELGEPLECEHEWEYRDDSFDHEFGTERIPPYEKCLLCDAERPFEDPRDYDEP